jgi:hypothetical protein
MLTRRIGIMALSLLLALLAILPTRAQGLGPKGGPFIPGSPPPPSPAFRQAAEAALQAYLQAHGPATPLARLLLNEQGHAGSVKFDRKCRGPFWPNCRGVAAPDTAPNSLWLPRSGVTPDVKSVG